MKLILPVFTFLLLSATSTSHAYLTCTKVGQCCNANGTANSGTYVQSSQADQDAGAGACKCKGDAAAVNCINPTGTTKEGTIIIRK